MNDHNVPYEWNKRSYRIYTEMQKSVRPSYNYRVDTVSAFSS